MPAAVSVIKGLVSQPTHIDERPYDLVVQDLVTKATLRVVASKKSKTLRINKGVSPEAWTSIDTCGVRVVVFSI